MYHYPKTLDDKPDEFPLIAHIPDAVLRRVDPTNLVLVAYLTTINPSVEPGVLLPKAAGDPSKKRKGSKKGVKVSPSEPSADQVEKVVHVSPKKVTKKVVKPVPTSKEIT